MSAPDVLRGEDFLVLKAPQNHCVRYGLHLVGWVCLACSGIMAGTIMDLLDRITKAIFSAIDEVNEHLMEDDKLEKSKNTVLYHRTGKLDSLKLVNLIIATEQRIEEEFGMSITLADDKAVSQAKSPFKTVGSFVEYIDYCMKGHAK